MRLKPALRSRFTLVPTLLVLLIGGWNLYVAQHDHGRISGRVVDASGHPDAGATVILYQLQFSNEVERARTQTDALGRFGFGNNRSHRAELQAFGPNGTKSVRRTIRLWFRAQDRVVAAPLVIEAP